MKQVLPKFYNPVTPFLESESITGTSETFTLLLY